MIDQVVFLSIASSLLAFSLQPERSVGPGKNEVLIRGRTQHVYYYPGSGSYLHQRLCILFAPGDEGNREDFFRQLLGALQWIEGKK